MFFSAITKNLNWGILTKTLVTFNGGPRIRFLGRGFTKSQYIRGNSLKGGLGNLREVGGFGEKEGVVFLRRG